MFQNLPAAAATVLVILLLPLPGLCQIDYPKLGKTRDSWFGDNPYAADSSVHAYVVAQTTEVNFRLGRGNNGIEREQTIRRVIRVLDRQGFRHSTVRIRYFDPENRNIGESVKTVKAYTHNPEGGKVNSAELAKGDVFTTRLSPEVVEVAFSMPNVVEGSVLDLEVVLSSRTASGVPTLYLQGELPIVETEGLVRAHEAFRFTPSMTGYHHVEKSLSRRPYPLTGVEGQEETTRFYATDVPAILPEPYVASMRNYLSQINLSLTSFVIPGVVIEHYSQDWAEIAKSLLEANGIRDALKVHKSFKVLAEACPSSLKTVEEKVTWAQKTIAATVHWNSVYSPYPHRRANAIIEAREGTSGEVNAMLLGLLNALEIKAHPVYISTRDNGWLIDFLINPRNINSLIVAVPKGENYVLLDATDPDAFPGMLPLDLINGRGLIAKEDTYAFIPLDEQVFAQQAVQAQLALGEDNYLSGRVSLMLKDYAAMPFGKCVDGLHTLALEDQQLFGPDFDVSELTVVREKGYSFMVTAQIRSKNPIDDLGGALALKPTLFSDWAQNPFQETERKLPMEFPYRIVETRDISIALPTGLHLETAPELVNVSTADRGSLYRYKVSATETGLNLTSLLVVKTPMYLPDEYAQIRGFFDIVAANETALLSVVPKP